MEKLNKISRGISGLFFIVSFLISGLYCSHNIQERNSIRIKGSDTMLYLTRNLAEEFMKLHPGISIYVEGGGTASGIESLVKGGIDICTASRSLKGEEVKLMAEHYGTVGISYIIAKDALTIFLNPGNKVKDLSLPDLKKIYTGELKNWKELGGEDLPVRVITRNPNSGTYLYFKEHVLEGEEYSAEAVVLPTTEKIVRQVLLDKNAIGYGGIGYQKDLISAKINGISPMEENVRNDSYPVSRYLYFYTTDIPAPHVKDFIDWVIGPQGQNIIKKTGYIPLWYY